jgi:hypothetical protein
VALVLSAFVLLVKPVVVVALLGAMRYRSRVSLETGLTLGALGLRYGDIDDETVTLLTVVALITIAASSYLLLNSEAIARRFAPAAPRRRGRPRLMPYASAAKEVVELVMSPA